MWLNASQQSMVGCDTDRRDMLSHRCPNCGHAEDEEFHMSMTEPRLLRSAQDASGYVLTRLLRTVRIISVILVLLLLVVTASLVFIMFGSPFLSHQSESMIQLHSLPESRSEKLQALDKVSNPCALLTAKNDRYLQWDGLQLTGDLTYSNENLTVPTKGWYYINLQVTFDFTFNDSSPGMCPNNAISLRLTVEHFSDRYKKFRDLLVSEDTMSCKMEWTKSIHTSGEFELEEHTILRVLPLHPELIRKDHTYTFFNVRRVSS